MHAYSALTTTRIGGEGEALRTYERFTGVLVCVGEKIPEETLKSVGFVDGCPGVRVSCADIEAHDLLVVAYTSVDATVGPSGIGSQGLIGCGRS